MPPKHSYDIAGDSDYGQGPEAQADMQAYQNINQMPALPERSLGPDQMAVQDKPAKSYNWTMTGTHISVSDQYEHPDLFWGMNHDDFALPHAWGTVDVSYRWETVWHLEGSNMAPHLVEQRLRKYAKEQGWKMVAMLNADGMPMESVKVASEPGSGWQTVPKDWYPDDFHGDYSGADYYGESDPPDEEIPKGPMRCSECDEVFPDYDSWRVHVDREHLNPQREPSDMPSPVVDLDEPWPAHFNTNPDVLHQDSINALGAAKPPPVQGPVPCIWDLEADRLFMGNPGERHSDIVGRFTPGGVVEGLYLPDGRMQFRNDTDMPYTVKHLVDLWNAMTSGRLPIKRIEKLENGKVYKLASPNIAHKVRKVAFADPAAHAVYSALSPEGNVYAVGGVVRDTIMGRVPHDVDLMVQGISPERIESLLSELPGKLDFTGARFGVFRYTSEDGSQVEVSLPRAETESPQEGRPDAAQTTVDPYLTVEDDLARRDFTANAMAVNLKTAKLIDPYDGSLDIKAKRLRTVSPTSFRDDPLRTVRALTAVSKLGFEPTEETKKQMAKYAPGLAYLEGDEIRKELDKLYQGQDPARAIALARDTNTLEHIYPEMMPSVGFDQKNKYHRLKLDDHLLEVLNRTAQLTDDPDVRMAALMHDWGKPASQWIDDEGFGHFYQVRNPNSPHLGQGQDHAPVGAAIARSTMNRLHYPKKRIDRVSHLVHHHMFEPFDTEAKARKRINKVGSQHIMDLLNIREADQEGKGMDAPENKVPVDFQRHLAQRVMDQGQPIGISSLVINGNDLKALGIPPGPIYSMILQNLAERVMEDPQLNNRHDLLLMAQLMGNEKTSNILDKIHKELDPQVWDRPETLLPQLKPSISKWILTHVPRVMVENGWPPNTDEYLKLILTGSETTYQWGKGSDIDVSLWIHTEAVPDWIRADLISLMVSKLDGTIVPGTSLPIQCFVVDSRLLKEDDLYRQGLRSAYDITNDKWIVPPDKSMAHNVRREFAAAYEYAKGIAEKFRLIMKYDPALTKALWDDLHTKRHDDMASGKGEMSKHNVAYKMLAHRGYLPKIERLTGEHIAARMGDHEWTAYPFGYVLEPSERPNKNAIKMLGSPIHQVAHESGLKGDSEASQEMLDIEPTQKISSWADVVNKAKRLMQSGQVNVLVNRPNFVAGVVQGDHGTYEVEISRDDPDSNAISGWSCTCPWGTTWAWDRTRNYKRFQGRVCSHALALFWQGRSTPLDVEDMPFDYQVPRGQKAGPQTPGQGQMFSPDITIPAGEKDDLLKKVPTVTDEDGSEVIPAMPEGKEQGQVPGQKEPIQMQGPEGEQPSLSDMTNPGIEPLGPQPQQQKKPTDYQRQQLQLWDIPSGGGKPMPATAPVSINQPPMPPDPTNPINMPGKFSFFSHKAKFGLVKPQIGFDFRYAADPFQGWLTDQLARGYTPRVIVRHPNLYLEARGGKIPIPGASPMGVSREGVPLYNFMDLGWDPERQMRIKAEEGGPYGPGAPEWRGQWVPVNQGSRAEVSHIEPLLSSAYVRVPLHYPGNPRPDARLHPKHLEGWVDFKDIMQDPIQRSPFRKPR